MAGTFVNFSNAKKEEEKKDNSDLLCESRKKSE